MSKKHYELEYVEEERTGEQAGPKKKLLEPKCGLGSDEEAIAYAEGYAISTLLFPDSNNEDLGPSLVKYKVLLNGAVIAEGVTSKSDYAQEYLQ